MPLVVLLVHERDLDGDETGLCHLVGLPNRIGGQKFRHNAVSSEVRMAFIEQANPKVASLASQGLFDPASLTPDDVRAICATALARVPDHRQNEIVQGRPLYEQIDMALAMVRVNNLPDEAT